MKFERQVVQTVDVDAIRVSVPVDDDAVENEEIPAGMFGVNEDGNRLTLTLGLDDRKVRGWPEGFTASVHIKARDEGTYELLAGDAVVAALNEDYVPGILPGEHYGDYLILDIQADGAVKGWRPNARRLSDDFAPRER